MALETGSSYPVYYAVSEDNKIANWRPFGQIFMAIPHLIVANVLGRVSQVCSVIGWFIILFTGKLPPGLANFIIMAQRYNARATGYAFGLTEQYPPFEFDMTASDPGNYAIRLDVNPELENRNRLTVGFRIFTVIPILIFAMIVFIGVAFVAFAAWFAVLFTGAYPVGMRNFVIKGSRLGERINGYLSLLTDQYPPFALA
jgi:hypothetical protein